MVTLNPISRPRRLQAVPDPRPYEINVGALAEHHVGRTIVIRGNQNILTGPLRHVPAESTTKPLLVLHVGDFTTALHPADAVIIIPDGYKATITVGPKPKPPQQQSSSHPSPK